MNKYNNNVPGNKYINNVTGEWIGPRDANGMPVYESPVMVTITDANGVVIEEWTATSERTLPEAEEMHESILNA